jgi:hypothetical protein
MRFVAALADFFQNTGLLFFRDVWFKDDNHSSCNGLPKAKKTAGGACGEVDECLGLRSGNHQPAKVGKVIPTTKGFKWLTARIHGLGIPKWKKTSRPGYGDNGVRVRVRLRVRERGRQRKLLERKVTNTKVCPWQ